MKKIIEDLFQGKYSITYTLEAIGKMVPREIRWLSKVPVLNHLTRIGQFFWFVTKIIFFATIISWFKPQYHHIGAKVALFVITFGLIFAAGWMMKWEFNNKKVAD